MTLAIRAEKEDACARVLRRVKLDRRVLALVAAGACIAIALSGFVAGAAVARGRNASFGDTVRFHVSVHDANGTLLQTSDPDLARRALAEGNPFLDPNLSARTYRAHEGVLLFTGAGAQGGFEPTTYLLGRRAGESVTTPLLVQPFGSAPRYHLPSAFGPFDETMALPRADALASNSTRPDGLPAAWAEGERILYRGLLPAVVGSDDAEGNVTLRVAASGGERIWSAPLGFFTRVLRDPEGGSFTFAPDLAPSQVFEALGCNVPEKFDLPRGRYRVVAADEDGFQLAAAPEYREVLFGANARVVFTILEVQAAPAWERPVAEVRAWLGPPPHRQAPEGTGEKT